MKLLVLSRQHGLLPFAHRLTREGHPVDTLVWQHEYEAAWHGQLDKLLRGSKGELTREALAPVVAEVAAGERAVLSDLPGVREVFPQGEQVFGVQPLGATPQSTLRLGGWFDGERLSLAHALVVDRGAWQGGLGPDVLGGATLVRIDSQVGLGLFEQLTRGEVDQLKANSFKGLVQFGLDFEGEPRVSGVEAGWPWLHTHTWLSELEGLGSLLTGGEARLASKFVCALPVTLPPWPSPGRAPQVAVENLTPQQQGRVFWHDVSVDRESRTLRTAGLDGLVGVARGAAESLALAQGRALEVALRVGLPEKQFRPDLGSVAAQVFAELENNWGVVL